MGTCKRLSNELFSWGGGRVALFFFQTPSNESAELDPAGVRAPPLTEKLGGFLLFLKMRNAPFFNWKKTTY